MTENNPFMRCTCGITEPHLTRDPLGTEAEMTPGDDETDPYEPATDQAPPEAEDFGLFAAVDPYNDLGPDF